MLSKFSAGNIRNYKGPFESGRTIRSKEITATQAVKRAAAQALMRTMTPRAPQRISKYGGSRTEVKSFDVTVTGGNLRDIATTPQGAEPAAAFLGITELNCIQQGAAFYQRIGTKVMMKSLELKFIMQANGVVMTLATGGVTIRYMVVYDRQPNKTFPSLADVLAVNDGAATFNAGVDMTNRSRFVVLCNQFYAFDVAQDYTLHVHKFIPLNLETEFGASGNTIGDLTTGSLLLIAFSSNAAIDCNLNQVSSRVRYMD